MKAGLIAFFPAMRAAVLNAPGVLELQELPDPRRPQGGALLAVKACAICGTDVKMVQQGQRDLRYPRVLGHEIVAGVLEIDRDCGIAVGDRVQVWPGIACGQCRPCLRGYDNRCLNMGILGFNRDGGLAEMVALPKECITRGLNVLPADTDPGRIALAEPLACCLNGQEQAMVRKGDVVLILGGGPIGCLHALLAWLLGAEKVIVTEKLENRLRLMNEHTRAKAVLPEALASTVAEETSGWGVDVILIAAPNLDVSSDLLKLLAPGGRLCLFSGPGSCVGPIDIRQMHYRELTIAGAYGCSSRHNRIAMELLASGAIDADWIITKRATLENIQDALDHSSQRAGLKSIIEF